MCSWLADGVRRSGKPSEHEPDHGDIDPGFFTAGKHFVVLGQAAPGGEPGDGALHNPTPFEDMEATGADLLPIDFHPFFDPDPAQAAPRMLHNVHGPAKLLLDPFDEPTLLVGAVSPDQLEAPKAVSQRFQQQFATLMVLQVGLMDQQMQNPSVRINQQMTLATFYALAAVIATKPPFWLVFTD